MCEVLVLISDLVALCYVYHVKLLQLLQENLHLVSRGVVRDRARLLDDVAVLKFQTEIAACQRFG